MNPTFYPKLDEQVYWEKLPNGLTVAVIPRPGFSRKLAYFVTDYGAMHTKFTFGGEEHTTPAGVAHYLEHKMFDMPGNRDVSSEFAALGAITNAFTSYDLTAYYFSCTENFDECLRLLLEFVSTPCFTAESVEKERGIIDQEIGMNADAPDTQVFENLMTSTFRSHPIRVPILGTSETIREITPEILNLCHKAIYTPGNKMLSVVGDVDAEAVRTAALEVLGEEKREVAVKAPFPTEEMTTPVKYTEKTMEVAMPTFSMAFKAESLPNGEIGVKEEMVADLAAEALFGESSGLYLKMYEDGLIDSAFGGGFEAVDDCAMLIISGDSDDPEAVRDAIIAEAARIAENGIEEDRFLRMKRSALGRRIRELDSFDSTCFRTCAYYYSGFDYFAFPGIYEQIDREDIRRFLSRVVTEERCSLSVITPHEEDIHE